MYLARRTIAAIAGSAAAAMLLVACGSGGGGSSQNSTGAGEQGGSSADKSQSATDWSTASSVGTSMDALVKAAKDEGSVTIIGPHTPEDYKGWADAFKDKYGIDVKYTKKSSGVIKNLLEQQDQAGQMRVDVFNTSSRDDVVSLSKEGLLAKYTTKNASKFPKSSTIPNYSVGVVASILGVAWNTETVPDELQKRFETEPLKALLDPALKGKVAIVDPGNGGSGMSVYANVVANHPDLGWDYLKQLAAQDPGILLHVSTTNSDLSAGTYWATIFGAESSLGQLAAEGAPVRFANPKPTSGTQFFEAITKKAPHPAAARLWMEYATTLEGQEAMSSAVGSMSVLSDWKDNREWTDKLSWYKLPDQSGVWRDWQTDPRFTNDGLKKFLEKWKKIFK